MVILNSMEILEILISISFFLNLVSTSFLFAWKGVGWGEGMG